MSALPVSPLAPKVFPKLPPVAGVRLSTLAAGERYRRRADLTLAELAPGTAVAGVLTQNVLPGAPIDWCRKYLPRGKARALIVNAGNANVFTGRDGALAVAETAAAVAERVGCARNDVFVASTGVIGETLRIERIVKAVPRLYSGLAADNWRQAADAIRTTDTFSKASTAGCEIDGVPVRINGIAKGSGMIAPDMATMLSFVFTDAKLPATVLRPLLKQAADRTFNAITVDSDTSTSDTLLLFATGKGPRHPRIEAAGDRRLRGFRAALEQVLRDLAQQVVRDGEGATKFIEVRVTGAASVRAAKRIARTVADSPLVKTAIAGEDANWGRVVMAVGKAGERADRDRLAIRIGGVLIADRGHLHPDYREAQVTGHMKGEEILIEIDVGVGRGRAAVWTCDLTHGYIDINADYRS